MSDPTKLALDALVSDTASAEVQRNVQQAIDDSEISVTVSNGVATLIGNSSESSRLAAERAALNCAGVQRVVNLIRTDRSVQDS